MSPLAALPLATATPGWHDLVGVLPELIVAGGFLLLMALDLLVPPARRGWLAVVSGAVLAAALAVSVWGWYDAGSAGRTVFFGAVAYDRLAEFANCVILVTSLLTVVISPGYLNRRRLHAGEYYALVMSATVGMMLLSAATSLMVIFLAVELLSISLYILSGFSRQEERSQEAAVKYLLLGSFASAFLLFGMALVYGETGHTQLAQIATAMARSQPFDPLLVGGVILVFVGLAFKVSAAPFHAWTPDVYQGAPTSVTTFMSVATKVAAFIVLIRVFDDAFASYYSRWSPVVIAVAILSMVIGNLAALTQNSIKRMLAYSGIAQAGYILIGVAVGVGTSLGIQGSLYYLAAYALTNLGAFAVVTVMSGRGEDLDSYDHLRGLWQRRPYVAGALAFFLLSLAGFPLTAGFIGKFLVFAAAIQGHNVALALWGIGTSAVSVFYYLRVILIMFQRPAAGEREYAWPRAGWAGSTVLAVSAAGTLVLGVFVALVLTVATMAQAGTLPGT
ncbi:MAG: NADH-quinone oxidoreductase subunit N [Candidatus Dormibacteria bacterium]